MGRIIDTLAVALLATALLTAGAYAGQHDGLHVTPENETVSTAVNTTVNVTFVVNNTADRPVQQGNLVVANSSDGLEPNSTAPIELNRLNASEDRRVPVEVSIPNETPDGNYTVTVAVGEGNRTVDNATGTVLVEPDKSGDDGSGSDGSDRTTETADSGAGSGGGAVPVAAGSSKDCYGFWKLELCIDIPSVGDIIDWAWERIPI